MCTRCDVLHWPPCPAPLDQTNTLNDTFIHVIRLGHGSLPETKLQVVANIWLVSRVVFVKAVVEMWNLSTKPGPQFPCRLQMDGDPEEKSCKTSDKKQKLGHSEA